VKLRIVRIGVRDFEAALQFYREQVGLETTQVSHELGWAQLDTGEANLALEHWPEGSDDEGLVGRFVGVSLEVDDVEATWRGMKERGVEFVGDPTRMPWGGVLAHFRDPDGNVLTLLGAPRG